MNTQLSDAFWGRCRYVIYIKAGVYTENVRIPKHKTNIMFQGDGADKTFITGSLSDSQYGMITWATATVGTNSSCQFATPNVLFYVKMGAGF